MMKRSLAPNFRAPYWGVHNLVSGHPSVLSVPSFGDDVEQLVESWTDYLQHVKSMDELPHFRLWEVEPPDTDEVVSSSLIAGPSAKM